MECGKIGSLPALRGRNASHKFGAPCYGDDDLARGQGRRLKVNLAVTLEEREALEALRLIHGVEAYSDLLTNMSLTQVVAEHNRILKVLEKSGKTVAEHMADE